MYRALGDHADSSCASDVNYQFFKTLHAWHLFIVGACAHDCVAIGLTFGQGRISELILAG